MPRSDCIQKDIYNPSAGVIGSEDCLYLNIYRPLVSYTHIQNGYTI